MRDIKFRCWNSFANTMQTWEDMVKLDKIHLLANNKHPYICMQYTGLKDKNGVGICEGDLIIDKDRDMPAIVEYRNENACFMLSSNSFLTQVCIDKFEYEIIGNIYQNPELLS